MSFFATCRYVGHYRKAIDASTAMFRDAATRIKAIKPSAKVMSVEALPWWDRAPLDPGGIIYKTMIHGNVDHRIESTLSAISSGLITITSQAPGPLSLLSEPYRRGHNFTMMGGVSIPTDSTRKSSESVIATANR